MSDSDKAYAIIQKAFIEWAKDVCPDWRTRPREEVDTLIKGFTGGYIMASISHMERDRVRKALAQVTQETSRLPQ